MQKQFRQTIMTLLSQGVPMILGIVLIPVLLKEMGAQRFGFLSVVWSLLGYFGFLDLGISRTITKMIAEEGTLELSQQNHYFVQVGSKLVFWMSVVGAAIASILVLLNFKQLFRVDEILIQELKWSGILIMIAIPMVVMTAYYRGVLEGCFRFTESNWIQVMGGLLLFVGPWVFWKVSPNMISVCIGVLISRIIVYLLALRFSNNVGNYFIRTPKNPFWTEARRLLVHGGWITVGNILAPVMANLDRLLLAQVIPLAKLINYSAPMEMISRLWVVPGGVTRIYFPKFAATKKDQELVTIFRSAYLIMGSLMVPITLLGLIFMDRILAIWISSAFALESTLIARIILLGVFVNAFNWITYGYLQSSDKVAWSIYTVFLELPLFLIFLYWAASRYGLLGAAWVWTGRMILDFILTHAVVAYFKRILLPFFVLLNLALALFLFRFYLSVL